ncbi:hypothetical protein POM88_004480 [Heracleum sosnowskyi]|uniref:Uncharacterized protein n=1 Tax=Heracleum sosnowskyi TaxID=360622 RepID=A0AAD8JN03_9APIA|nr:hypothetical protein POM88_004480 [Heracleum sosnowskyi]
MAAEESLIHLLHLFDSLWFENNLNPPFVCKVEDDNDQPKLARILTFDDQEHDHDKSILITTSQESLSSGDMDTLFSPNSVLMRSPAAAKLETILSGKESSESVKEKQVNNSSEKINTTRKRRKKRTGKGGLSDKNSSLVKIIPGLQRFGEGEKEKEKEKNSSHNADTTLIKRPYLSQAWEITEYKRKVPAARKLKWKINAAVLDNEMDMKHQLRFWAQSVASAVK